MTGVLRFLAGRTPRQRRLRLGELMAFLGVLALIAVGLLGWIDESPTLALFYLSAFVILLIIWVALVLLDLREGLHHVVEKETKKMEDLAE